MIITETDNSEKLIDLHTHSLISDGSMTPAELVRHAAESGISAVALTDHDRVSGVAEAAAEGAKCGVEVIPGIELSAQSDTETHILGYFVNPEDAGLLDVLRHTERAKFMRMKDTEERLAALGVNVTYEDARSFAGSDNIGRAHFAKAMVAKGYSPSVSEAFGIYLGTGKPAYSNRQYLTDEAAIKTIHDAGGIAFLAHLHLTKKVGDDLYSFVKRLKAAGLDGIEGYYTDYTPDMEREYRGIADELGLVLSGGSDFHAAMKPHIAIGRGTGNLRIPYTVLEKMKSYYERKNARKTR